MNCNTVTFNNVAVGVDPRLQFVLMITRDALDVGFGTAIFHGIKIVSTDFSVNWLKVKDTVTFNPFPNKPWFLRVCSTSLLKTLWEKEKLLVTSNFTFSHSAFYPLRERSAIFIQFEIVVCKLYQFGRV